MKYFLILMLLLATQVGNTALIQASVYQEVYDTSIKQTYWLDTKLMINPIPNIATPYLAFNKYGTLDSLYGAGIDRTFTLNRTYIDFNITAWSDHTVRFAFLTVFDIVK